ncbi:ABC transporter ATP-binding protein [Ruminococcus sp. NK3A76]|uniref:ABC transporter ATP-binding protein n=1 Tax=Ruminococcus sp. NK3A76 TaxID=877411 RepID=UPI00048C2907|nr:ABC transporter ATP-binding protein [Ruminococcus sp. NK3A76]
MIKTENLTRTYGKGEGKVVALKGIDLTINDGEMVAIIGKSGSGKSTLLNLIGGLDAPTEGKIFYNDTEIGKMNDTELSKFRLNNVGFVFQFFDLIPELTAEENILLPSKLAKKKENNADSIYSALDISDRIKHYPAELSGGQQQRAAIARALINSPDVLLCDEPTGNLDKRSGEEVMALLKTLNEKGKTVIIVTHDADIAGQCERIIEISDGHIV